MLKTAIIGHGYSAKTFHIPYLRNHSRFKFSAISTSKSFAHEEFPSVKVYKKHDEMLQNPEIDLVIITSPNTTHFKWCKEALLQKKHVLVEKPFVMNVSDANYLIDLSKEVDRKLVVFQNRRWDGDYLTIKKMIKSEELGEIKLFESHFDRFRPEVRDRWRENSPEHGGIWFDLGSHLIDQSLDLFGKPKFISANLRSIRPGSEAIDYFHAQLHYDDKELILHADLFQNAPNARFSLKGTKAQYVIQNLDPQESFLKEGLVKDLNTIGAYPDKKNGKIYFDDVCRPMQTAKGDYGKFFSLLADHLVNDSPSPVSLSDSLAVVRILEKGVESSYAGQKIEL